MNTKSYVIISFLIIVTLGSMVYAFVQQTAAQVALRHAEEQRMIAIKAREQHQTALQDLELLKQKCK